METVQHDETWRRLHERLRGIARRRAMLDAEEAQCLREAHETKLWRRLGYAHMNEYLERELGYAPQVGIERLRVALALGTLPQIEASLACGGLAYSAVRELTRVATPDTEQDWLDKVRGKNLRQIEAMVSGKKQGDRPDDPSNPDLAMRVVRLELAPTVFALFRQVQSAMADEHGGRLDDSALMEVLCRRAMEGDGRADRPPYQIAISQCESCGRGWQNGAGREVDVGREVVERARCDAELIGSLDTEAPERLRSTVTPRIRRQVFARDHYRCTVPGCRSARNLDVHHIEYQSHGGSHEMSNVTVLCSAHHNSLHEGLLMIRGHAPDTLEFTWREAIGPSEPHIEAVRQPRRSQPAIDSAAQPASDHPAVDSTLRTMSGHPVPGPSRVPTCECPTVDAALPPTGAPPNTIGGRPELSSVRGRSAATSKSPVIESATLPADEYVNPATIDENARLALVTAGYRPREARAAVENARPRVGASATLEQVIREALRQCATSIAGRCAWQSGA